MVGLEHTRELFSVILLDYIGVFGWISRKNDEISKILANFGVLRRGIGIPPSSVGPRQGMACPCCGVAKRRLGQALGTPRRSKVKSWRRPTPQRNTVDNMKIFVFCFVFLFRYSKKLSIGLMRTL